MLARATSACFGSYSNVVTRPSGPAPRASQIVLNPPSVPISRTRRTPVAAASKLRNLPCCADTAIFGNPAASLASKAADNTGSSSSTVWSRKASTSAGVNFGLITQN